MPFRLPPQDIALVDPKTGLTMPDWYDKLKLLEIPTPPTVATLPVVGNMGSRNFVTDATVTTFASVVAGGGANKVPVYDDGTNWRIG